MSNSGCEKISCSSIWSICLMAAPPMKTTRHLLVKSDSPTKRLPLRIGLLIDSFVQRKWIHQVIGDIQASGFAEISVVIKNEATQSERSAGRLKNYWRNRKYLLYALYGKIDERRVKVSPDAFEPPI